VLRWVFLDVGNVVMNDDPVMAYIYEALFRELGRRGIEMSEEELLAEREEEIRAHGTGHWSVLAERYLGTEGLEALARSSAEHLRRNYLAYHNVLPGMTEAIEELNRDFCLAVLANQMREAEQALAECGFSRHFRFYALSEVIDRHKPDPEIFRWALEQAACRPEEAVMVGDRIDNDVVPAKAIGLWTIWFHAPLQEKGYQPPPGFPRCYFESQRRISVAMLGPAGPTEEPDGEATSAAEMVREIHRIREASQTRGPLRS
jgi:HAD superfamily hydrolase (TIGR01509 family)